MKILRFGRMFFCLACVLILCCACGSTKTKFNTLKEADCFVEKSRINPKYSNFRVIFSMSNMGDPEPITSNASTAANYVISGPVGGTLKTLSKKPFKHARKLFLSGTVQTGARYVTIYRNEPGKPLKDIGAVAIEMAGEKPISPCCVFTGVKVAPSSVYTAEYRDENSHLTAAKFIRVFVGFNVKDEFKGSLSDDDWKPFLDYTVKVGNNIKGIVEEDLKHPSLYCSEVEGL